MNRTHAARLLATAHHEAGHAIVSIHGAQHLGITPFRYVTVKPSGGALGHVQHGKHPAWTRGYSESKRFAKQAYWEHVVIVGFAGRIAEEKYRGRRARWGYESDYSSIADIGLTYGGEEEEVHKHWFRWLFERSRGIVDFHWKAVQEVAAELIERETLSVEDVKIIMFPRAEGPDSEKFGQGEGSEAETRSAGGLTMAQLGGVQASEKTLVVIGIAHEFQYLHGSETQFHNRVRLVKLLGALLRTVRPLLVFEEAKFGPESIACRFCKESWQFYRNIDMPMDERRARGVPTIHPDIKIPGEPPVIMTSEQDRLTNLKERGAWMRRQVEEAIETAPPIASIVIVCGAEHMNDFNCFNERFQSRASYDLTK